MTLVGLKVVVPGVGFGEGGAVGGAVGLKVVGGDVGGEAVNRLFEQVSGILSSVA